VTHELPNGYMTPQRDGGSLQKILTAKDHAAKHELLMRFPDPAGQGNAPCASIGVQRIELSAKGLERCVEESSHGSSNSIKK
jgi:hypothetical protein